MVKVLDPRTPVIVGTGQVTKRDEDPREGSEAVDLMAEAAARADRDSGGRGVAAAIDSVRVVKTLSWRYRDPGALVAERLGARPAQSLYSTDGGQTPQALLNRTAAEIAAGDLELALLCGGEAWRTRQRYRRDGRKPPWTSQGEDVAAADPFGPELDMIGPAEAAQGLVLPVHMYAIFEVALRAASARTPAEHRRHLGRLWSRFSEIASTNPYAWIRTPRTPEEIVTPTSTNRYVGHPYTLAMNSNNNVEQAAAVLLCSAGKADAMGVPRERWVFPLAGAEAADHPHVSNRADLRSSPAIRTAGQALFEGAGLDPGAIAHVDLYSCFPSAVQISARELGLGTDRDLTVTGGMSFAGGPWNNYAMHAIATMAGVLRGDPGTVGLCTGNGGHTTKHALGLYSTEPPAGAFRLSTTTEHAQAAPRREVAPDDHDGPVTVESYTVSHGREGGREVAFVASLLADGRRAWCKTSDPDVMATLVDDREHVGDAAHRHADGTLSLL